MMLRRQTDKSAICNLQSAIRRGAAAAELAIVLPFVALMFVAAIDFCRVYYAAQTVENCARSGALYASGAARRNTSTTTPEDAAKQAAVAEGASLDPPLQTQDVDVTLDSTTATVTVTYRFSMFTSYPGLPGVSVVRRSVTMPLAPKAPGEK
ncbi:MAG: pilus assembly protein [Planctomycetes bacterium]|nr:pilus assembly protein [Planctomycetota bacterium]